MCAIYLLQAKKCYVGAIYRVTLVFIVSYADMCMLKPLITIVPLFTSLYISPSLSDYTATELISSLNNQNSLLSVFNVTELTKKRTTPVQ